ncbi:MAG: UDP-N-acetyl-D-glucosamine dehydrogenase [Thermodesulfobacterium geofontis]|uniref:UDP-N-acetyl-D-glucosamine dehydrogenase n=1 Tax=Thermodesulfobacterium geofontis TaxID=1295609 RepID=A0A2N7QFP7_9BACT|nr:MAG: UDP-N-acetyl-D-glucosamine dehydrogenase [Thermodesulfobacterium geofontis]
MNKVKVAVIGVGHLGRFHAKKFAEIPEVELLAIVDINPERIKETLNLLGEKGSSVKAFTDYKEIISLVDAVSIATPTITHYEIAKDFLKAGKPVFLEKPLAHELKLAEELVEISIKKNLPFQIGYIERFQEAVKNLLQNVKDSLFIEAHRLSSFAERNLDIDVILDLMIHDLDLALLIKNYKRVEFIHAVGAPLFTKLPDIVNARIVFEDGTTCNFTASRISLNKQRKFRVFSKGAYYVVDTLEKSYLEVKVDPQSREYKLNKKSYPESDPLKEELESFVRSVINGKKVKVSGEEALKSLELAFQIKKQVEENLKKFL